MRIITTFAFQIIMFAVGVGVAGYFCLYGGIIDIVEAINVMQDGNPLPAAEVAWGILRILLTPICAWFIIFLCGLGTIFFLASEDI